jgi:hypothetical protein
MGRRAFIVGAAASAAGAVAACGGDGGEDGAGRDRSSTTGRGSGLTLKGVNYDTEREVWRSEFVRREIETIRHDLHCNSILLLGSDLDRLTQSAAVAADNGLHVWFEPRNWQPGPAGVGRFDASAADTIDFVATAARAAEDLRAEHPDVGLSLGVELTLFMAGLVPGDDMWERAAALETADPAVYNAQLNDFLADAAAAVRPIFGGQLTYSSGTWEGVRWDDLDLDVVGIDLYRDADNEATFVDDVRALHQFGKPVVITEFGCCSFRGAEDLGGNGFSVVDWAADPPVIADDLVRDEQVQADYVDELLDVFEAQRVHGAFVYNFVEPDNPHLPDPHADLDMAGYGIVKCYPSGTDQAYDRTGHFEPKAAFATIAERFRP